MDVPIEPPRLSGKDASVLPALLARLGPEVSGDLLRQLVEDLVNLCRALDTALRAPVDTAEIARQAHVLIALAGTVGATSLVAQARALLDAAHATDTPAAAGLAAAIRPGIETLVDFVASCPLPRTRSRP